LLEQKFRWIKCTIVAAADISNSTSRMRDFIVSLEE
jgi:hypothetical protein